MIPMDDVIVIGAGAAGLAAARDLAATGLKVTILEARDRIGGRIYSHREYTSQLQVELGAEFVHGRHPALMKVIEAGNIPLRATSERRLYFENGVLADSNNFWNNLNAVMDRMSLDQPDQSFQEFLASLPDDEAFPQAKAIATRYVEGFHAGRVDRIGVHGLIKASEAANEIDGDHSFRVDGPYDSVPAHLWNEAQKFGVALRRDWNVNIINWSAGGVEVSTLGETFKADCVLITLPLGVLKQSIESQGDIDFDSGAPRFLPALPTEKQAAIRNLQMGQAVRVTLEFREPFWDKATRVSSSACVAASANFPEFGFIHYPEAPLPTWWTTLHGSFGLVGWCGGPKAAVLAQRHPDDLGASIAPQAFILRLKDAALHSLEMIFGTSEKELRRQLLTFHTYDWTSDPYSRGAYTYLPVNGLEWQQRLAAPVGEAEFGRNVLFFAGEATSVGHVGTVHGAIASGERAAQEILNRNRER